MVVRHRLAGVTDPKVILLLTSPTWGQPSAKQPSPVHPIQDLRLGFCRGPPEGEDGPWHRPSCVWLSVAFVRMLQLCRLRRAEQDELAIEVVMFGQEALVLRRQITRPALRPADRAVFAGSSRLMSKVHRGGSSFSPRRCSAGVEISSAAGGRIGGALWDGRHCPPESPAGARIGFSVTPGAGGGNRTHDLTITNRLRYQLRHTGLKPGGPDSSGILPVESRRSWADPAFHRRSPRTPKSETLASAPRGWQAGPE